MPASRARASRKNRRHLLPLAGGALLYFVYLQGTDSIINYPPALYGTLFGLYGVLALGLLWRQQAAGSGRRRARTGLEVIRLFLDGILPRVVGSWFLAGISLIPFNYYNIHFSASQPEITEVVPIQAWPNSNWRKNIFFRYKGRMNKLPNQALLVDGARPEGEARNYRLVLMLRPALAGTFVLVSWKIVNR